MKAEKYYKTAHVWSPAAGENICFLEKIEVSAQIITSVSGSLTQTLAYKYRRAIWWNKLQI